MRSCKHNDEGFTGLEAAIVLIAFVVVAAVFSYVVLGAGFFTTQKAQETVHTSVQQTTSTVEPSGPMSIKAATPTTVSDITFYLQIAAGGAGVDMSKVTYTVSTPKKMATFDNLGVTYTWVKQNNATNTLQTAHNGTLASREMILVDINPGFDATAMTNNDRFTVEVKPPIGAALPMTSTVPGDMKANTWYEVY
ncbi:archaellin/type IV pilin N-terminal domain-containing protein [Methanoregula sp.]|jgi:flagellin FlaB|uniref:archaellin/type IV pilin N-terminal domain-containing protein n=1 Tax=Methanoregula sp. TaxID=2052170 RepID=UPI003567DB3F